jgi:hypothetical protein
METQTFTHFPTLPTELPLKIWNFALPPPPIVTLAFLDGKRTKIGSKMKLPALLYVNLKSRLLAQERYSSHLSIKRVDISTPFNHGVKNLALEYAVWQSLAAIEDNLATVEDSALEILRRVESVVVWAPEWM